MLNGPEAVLRPFVTPAHGCVVTTASVYARSQPCRLVGAERLYGMSSGNLR